MHRLTRDRIVYHFDKAQPPALTVDAGAEVVLETYDAATGTIRSAADLLDHLHLGGANPVPRPIYVRGVQPGDVGVCQICEPGEIATTARTVFPRII